MFYVLPKELIHEFFHHDTVDMAILGDSGTSIGHAHQHCDLLQLTSPPFQYPVSSFSFYVSSFSFYYTVEQSNFPCKDLAANQYMRGPPLI